MFDLESELAGLPDEETQSAPPVVLPPPTPVPAAQAAQGPAQLRLPIRLPIRPAEVWEGAF